MVWTPPATGPSSREIWAPELHYLQGKWYLYSADAGNNDHRVWVLENSSPNPLQGTWTNRGKLADLASDRWSIYGSLLEHQGQLYFIWSGWEGNTNGRQNICLAPMN